MLSAYRQGGRGSSALPLHRWLNAVNKPVVILSEDVEYQKGRTFVGSVFESHTGLTGSLVCSIECRPAAYFGHLGKDVNGVPRGRRLLTGFGDRLQNFWRRLANCLRRAILERGFSWRGVTTGALWTAGRLELPTPKLDSSRAGDVLARERGWAYCLQANTVSVQSC